MSNLPAKYKTVAAIIIGVLGQAAAQGLVSGAAAKWVAIGIGALTAAGVYQVPNEPEVDGERGAVDPGSLALGLLIGAVALFLYYR